MSIISSVRIVILGLTTSFILRLVGTLVPSLFESYTLAVISVNIHLATNIFLAYFFLLLARDYLDQQRENLRSAALWAGAGSVIYALMNLRFVLRKLRMVTIPGFLRDSYIDTIGPLIGIIFILAFFVRFKKNLLPDERPDLKRGTRSAVFGYTLFTIMHVAILLNYYISDTSKPSHISGIFRWFILPLLFVGFIAILDFYRLFHRYLRWSRPSTLKRDRIITSTDT